MNVVLLRGVLSSDPRLQELPSGSLLMRWEVTTTTGGEKLSVPVTWFDPPTGLRDLVAQTEVVVLGVVRRRFFRTGAQIQSTTEVVASAAATERQAKAARRMIERAADQVVDAASSPR